MENKTLWDKVEKTPEQIIEKVDAGDGKQLNSVSSIHRIKKATEIFGTYGDKWGIKNLKHSEKTIFNNLVLATLDATFFYEYENKKVEFEISNSLAIVSVKDKQMQVNYTYRKAIETDTITKALSRLGFNADIYTDGELVASASTGDELLSLELVQVGEDLTGDSDATQS